MITVGSTTFSCVADDPAVPQTYAVILRTLVHPLAATFTPRLQGLTGPPDRIATVVREHRVNYAPHRTGLNPGDHTMDHSSVLYVMGLDGKPVRVIRADKGSDAIARDLPV